MGQSFEIYGRLNITLGIVAVIVTVSDLNGGSAGRGTDHSDDVLHFFGIPLTESTGVECRREEERRSHERRYRRLNKCIVFEHISTSVSALLGDVGRTVTDLTRVKCGRLLVTRGHRVPNELNRLLQCDG